MVLLQWRRQLYMRMCLLLLLLLAVALPAPNLVVADGECYNTAMKVPRWCRVEFIKAMWNNDHHGISRKCCILLGCVRDPPCFHVLRDFCAPPNWARDCTWLPPLRTSKPPAPAPLPMPS